MNVVMVGLRADAAAVLDWARSAGIEHSVVGADFVEVSLVEALMRGRRRSHVGGFESVEILVPKLRPGRAMWRLSRFWRGIAFLLALSELRRRGFRVDVVHSHRYIETYGAELGSKWAGVPFCHTEHYGGLTFRVSDERPVSRAGVKMLTSMKENAARFYVVGPAAAEGVERLGLGAPHAVTGNPVNEELFSLPGHGKASEFVVLTVGYLEPLKRTEIAIEGFAMFLAQGGQGRLGVIGGGSQEESLKSLVRSLEIEADVSFLGQVDRSRVAEEMTAGEVLVHVSRSESFGAVVVEAMYSGLDVVASDSGGVTSMLANSDFVGLRLVDSTPQAVAVGLLEAYREWSRATNIERRDHKHLLRTAAVSRFSIERFGTWLDEEYRAVLSATE